MDSTWASKAEIRHIWLDHRIFIRVKNLYKKSSDHQRVWLVCSPREEGTPVLEVQDLVPEDTRILKNRGWDFFPEK